MELVWVCEIAGKQAETENGNMLEGVELSVETLEGVAPAPSQASACDLRRLEQSARLPRLPEASSRIKRGPETRKTPVVQQQELRSETHQVPSSIILTHSPAREEQEQARAVDDSGVQRDGEQDQEKKEKPDETPRYHHQSQQRPRQGG